MSDLVIAMCTWTEYSSYHSDFKTSGRFLRMQCKETMYNLSITRSGKDASLKDATFTSLN